MDEARRIFRTTEEAFDFCCANLGYELKIGVTLPAVVADASSDYGTPTPIKRRETGHQIAVLNVPSKDGVMQVIGETARGDAPDLEVGDFVEWRCGTVASGVCIGLIVGRLAPEIQGAGWRMMESFE